MIQGCIYHIDTIIEYIYIFNNCSYMLPSINERHDKIHDILSKCISLNGVLFTYILHIIKPNIGDIFPDACSITSNGRVIIYVIIHNLMKLI